MVPPSRMSFVDAFLLVIGSGLIAIGLGFAVRRLTSIETRRRHQPFATSIFLQLGVLFSVILAFVLSNAIGDHNVAEQAVAQERAALHGFAMVASALPPDQARLLMGIETSYIRQVIGREWPMMRRFRRGDDATELALSQLVQTVARLSQDNPRNPVALAQMLALLNEVHQQATIRLVAAKGSLPAALWVVLIAFSLLLIVLGTLNDLEQYVALLLFPTSLAVSISALLVFVALLQYPFEGALAISSEAYTETLAKIIALDRGP
jgi:hypothetical protein